MLQKHEQNYFNFWSLYYDQMCLHLWLNGCFWLFRLRYEPLRTRKAYVPELDNVACSSVRLSKHTRNEAIAQRINYNNATNHSDCLQQIELLRSHDIHTVN